MKKICFLFFCLPLFSLAQDNGVSFENSLSWAQVIAKAKAEHKYVFLDCYASWCGPCKLMEQEVYPDPLVGAALSRDFISFKLQLDRTAADNAQVKAHYADAAEINKLYSVRAYPTFLFFNPDGQLVHKSLGYKPVAQFIRLTSDARDPDKQYYTLLKRCEGAAPGQADWQALARQAQSLGDEAVASKAGALQIVYLLGLDDAALYQPDHIRFIADFTRQPGDKGFQWVTRNAVRIDAVMKQRNFSRGVLDDIILKETTDSAAIAQKYGAVTADRLHSKTLIYQSYGNNWPAFTAALVHYTDTYEDMDDAALLNKNARYVLQYSNKKSELTRALVWTGKNLERSPANAAYQNTQQALKDKLAK